jgi:hypothetical protein
MNNSPYLDRPFLPLAVALPWMPAEIEAQLARMGPRYRTLTKIRGCAEPAVSPLR